MTIPFGLAIGGLVSLLVTVAGAAILALVVLNETIGENGVGYGSAAVLMLAAITGAWSALAAVKKNRLQVCLLSGGVYYLLLLGTTALFFGGQYRGMGVTAVVILAGALIVAFFPGKERGKFKVRKRGYR